MRENPFDTLLKYDFDILDEKIIRNIMSKPRMTGEELAQRVGVSRASIYNRTSKFKNLLCHGHGFEIQISALPTEQDFNDIADDMYNFLLRLGRKSKLTWDEVNKIKEVFDKMAKLMVLAKIFMEPYYGTIRVDFSNVLNTYIHSLNKAGR